MWDIFDRYMYIYFWQDSRKHFFLKNRKKQKNFRFAFAKEMIDIILNNEFSDSLRRKQT